MNLTAIKEQLTEGRSMQFILQWLCEKRICDVCNQLNDKRPCKVSEFLRTNERKKSEQVKQTLDIQMVKAKFNPLLSSLKLALIICK